MQPKLWTLNGLAVELGRDRRALAKDLEDLTPDIVEEIPCGAVRDRGQIDIAGLDAPRAETSSDDRVARFWRMSRVVEHLYGRRSTSGGDFNTERARLAKMQADKMEIELAERRGELAYVSDVAEQVGRLLATVRAGYLAVPVKVAPRLVNQRDVSSIEATLREHMDEAMSEVHDYLARTLDDDAATDQLGQRVCAADPGARGECAGTEGREEAVPAGDVGDQRDRTSRGTRAGGSCDVSPTVGAHHRPDRGLAPHPSALSTAPQT